MRRERIRCAVGAAARDFQHNSRLDGADWNRMRHWCCLALLAAGPSFGCAGPLRSAVEHFEAGQLPDAAADFRGLEPRFTELAARERTEYALYRGLTHLALGDLAEAERWLAWVKRETDQDPRCLSDAERGRLLSAWRSMGHMPGESGGASAPPHGFNAG